MTAFFTFPVDMFALGIPRTYAAADESDFYATRLRLPTDLVARLIDVGIIKTYRFNDRNSYRYELDGKNLISNLHESRLSLQRLANASVRCCMKYSPHTSGTQADHPRRAAFVDLSQKARPCLLAAICVNLDDF